MPCLELTQWRLELTQQPVCQRRVARGEPERSRAFLGLAEALDLPKPPLFRKSAASGASAVALLPANLH